MQVDMKIQALYANAAYDCRYRNWNCIIQHTHAHILLRDPKNLYILWKKMFWRQNEQWVKAVEFPFSFSTSVSPIKESCKAKTIPNISKVERILDIWVVTALWAYLFLSCNFLWILPRQNFRSALDNMAATLVSIELLQFMSHIVPNWRARTKVVTRSYFFGFCFTLFILRIFIFLNLVRVDPQSS